MESLSSTFSFSLWRFRVCGLFLVLVMLHASPSSVAGQFHSSDNNNNALSDDDEAVINRAIQDAYQDSNLLDGLVGVESELGENFGAGEPVPVVIWHGMGDTCCGSGSMGYIKKFIEEHVPNIYVISLRIGHSTTEDFENSYFMNSNDQIEEACRQIRANPKLSRGYTGIGFSQGGQFVRALAQRCSDPPALNLISIGGQQQGVYGLPRCPGENQTICNIVRKLLDYGAYTSFVQKHLVQAQYWHDPINENEYREKSLFLADINNENEPRNETYKANLLRLRNFVMVEFADDTIVDPRISELFGYYKSGQATEMVPLQQTQLYQEDWLGLKQLDSQGKIKMYSVPGDHLQLDMNWFANVIVGKYLTQTL